MKYCTKCGKQLFDEAVLCPGCGCPVASNISAAPSVNTTALLKKLSSRLNTNGIIWLVIGILQILAGIWLNWCLVIIGILNIVSSVADLKYSKTVTSVPQGIVKKYEPLTGPIITLVYNLVIGGFIGVIGSVYYFIAVRGLVMENKAVFEQMEQVPSPTPSATVTPPPPGT